jgi:hypothetical protein
MPRGCFVRDEGIFFKFLVMLLAEHLRATALCSDSHYQFGKLFHFLPLGWSGYL